MNTIFDKAGIGIEEMKGYLSQIPGMLEFKDLKPDILAAQDELTKYVGEEIVEKAICHYTGDKYQDGNYIDLDELVYKVQDVVTLFAYRDYALNKDTTHTATGRVVRIERETSTINLKLIDNDDIALQRKGQRALERLIKYIDKKKYQEWTDSAIYKQTRELFIWNSSLFDRYFPIEKNTRLFLLIVPMIRKAQIEHIVPRLSDETYSNLMEKVKSDSIKDPADLYLYDLICYPLAEMAMSEAYLKLPLQLFPEKMTQQLWGPGNGASALVLREKMVADIEKKANESIRKLENELEKRAASEAGIQITDDLIIDIVDRMDAANLYVRV